jgi:long-chain fatty acid transport protein
MPGKRRKPEMPPFDGESVAENCPGKLSLIIHMMLYRNTEAIMFFGKSKLLIVCGLCLFTSSANAGGPLHGARAAGMGTAFIGLADDPSALLHSPAGITQLSGTQLYAGFTAIQINSEFSSVTGKEETRDQTFFPPHLYLVSDFGSDSLVFGLGLTAPFGIGGRKWDADGLTRYLSTENTIATFELRPTVAWRVTPDLSVAAGIGYLYAEMEMERRVDQGFPAAADGWARAETDGDGWGYNLGLLYRLNDSWQLGLAYRSEIEVDFRGELRLSGIAAPLQPLFAGGVFRTAVSSATTFPEIYSIGVAFRADESLVLAADFELARWSSFDQTRMRIAQPVPEAGIVDTTTVLDWADSSQIKVGAEYALDDAWRLRAGYAFVQGVVPERSLGPDNPDANQHLFCTGLGWTRGRFTLDLFYSLGLFEDQQVDNTLLEGEYQSNAHNLGVSFGYRF